MNLRQAYQQMIKTMPGGMEAMAAATGMTTSSLHNRLYEVKGQEFSVTQALAMQSVSDTTLFAEAIARTSGGVFMKLPDITATDRDDLLTKFNDLQAKLGDLSRTFNEATRDDEIDARERGKLEDIQHHIHKATAELLALSFQIYCRPETATEPKIRAVR